MKNNQPLISIIINCFNGEKYLNEALNSIFDQSYNNWEIIFWDNQSTDSSAKIFKSYNDKRSKYFLSNKHTSLYEARNLAIEKAAGDFISFLDVDDMWEKNKLAKQIVYFDKNGVGAVYSNYWILKKNVNKKKLFTNEKLPTGNIYKNLCHQYNIGILTIIIRKKFYLELTKKFDKRFSIIGDYDLILRLSKICIFECVQEPLAFYRLHGENYSNLYRNEEINEMEVWLNENKLNLTVADLKKANQKLNYSRFMNYKIDGKYKKCFSVLLNLEMSILKIKSIIIFLVPIPIVKKFSWFYLD